MSKDWADGVKVDLQLRKEAFSLREHNDVRSDKEALLAQSTCRLTSSLA